MPPYLREVYAGRPETGLYEDRGDSNAETTVLLGSWLGVVEEPGDGWLKVETYGSEFWVAEADTRDDSGLKIFFVDVGQGDGCIVEAPGRRMLVDGGPNNNLRDYLTRWKYDWMKNSSDRIRFDAVFVSHFDYDHFKGLISILEDTGYEFGNLYHPGIARFHDTKSVRPAHCDTALGQTNYDQAAGVARSELHTTFDDIEDARALRSAGGLMATFDKFLEAAVNAHDDGRLDSLRRLTERDSHVPDFGTTADLTIRVLGPVTVDPSGAYSYHWFDDDGHTINGNSLVLRLEYGNRSFLLGGDLNTESEDHLLAHHTDHSPFRVDVTKACHHGASEFTVDFLEAVNPYATVISSGDNENYAHPRADAVGCAGRYTRGARPLVFSTELARSYHSAREIHYGNINLRSDGDTVVIAQMYEKKAASDPWDSYVLP